MRWARQAQAWSIWPLAASHLPWEELGVALVSALALVQKSVLAWILAQIAEKAEAPAPEWARASALGSIQASILLVVQAVVAAQAQAAQQAHQSATCPAPYALAVDWLQSRS